MTDNRTEFRQIVDMIIETYPRAIITERSKVLNGSSRPAGGPNGIIERRVGFISPEIGPAQPVYMTDEDELAMLDRSCALEKCCEAAAREISGMFEVFTESTNSIAAVIYKHMRNGREL